VTRYFYEKDIAGCGVLGIMSEQGDRFGGDAIVEGMGRMHERGNGLGAGFAAYGIYPDLADFYAFHLILDSEQARLEAEARLGDDYHVELGEPIPTRSHRTVRNSPILWRYFMKVKEEKIFRPGDNSEEDFVVQTVMEINSNVDGAFVASSGKNMGVFKGVGFPEDIGDFYKLEEYQGYIWTGHNRFPTNSAGWWGGAHPFSLLGWSVVHNGEISSYGTNKRYLETFGYQCTLFTDTEVVAYLIDLLVRRHGLDLRTVGNILAPPFWDEIDRYDPRQRAVATALRVIYPGALLNGPFSIIVGHPEGMFGLNDRIKLRPLVAARRDDRLVVASEEAAIRHVCPTPERVWAPKGGEIVIGAIQKKKDRRASRTEEHVRYHVSSSAISR
jgi:glutamate synthase domain-containing protein 1